MAISRADTHGSGGGDTAEASAPKGLDSGEVVSSTARAETVAHTSRAVEYKRRRFEARKVRRLVRHVDPWSTLKLSTLLALCMWVIVMVASVIMWTIATNAGTIDSLESFVNSSLSLQDWSLDGNFLFRQFGLVTLLFSVGFVLATVVATLVFNLVSDIIGGVWISVIEEETARPVAESNQ